MLEIQFDEAIDGFLFKTTENNEFISPASQDVLRRWKRPLWQPSHESKNTFLPHWKRPELFRHLNRYNTQSVVMSHSFNLEQAAIATPSGKLSLDPVKRKSRISLSDRQLYHYKVQQVFCLFTQFDTLTNYHISAFLSMKMSDVDNATQILHSQGILKRAYDWEMEEKAGKLWLLDRGSSSTHNYQLGLDPLVNLFSFGNQLLSDSIVPGSGSNSAIRHNLFMTEVVLRLGETADNVIGLWGDLFTNESMFHEPNPYADLQRKSHGDAAVVTKDGSIIIFEMVTSSGIRKSHYETLLEKTASWVGIIADSDMDINVLFVDAAWNRDRRVLLQATDYGVFEHSKKYSHNESRRQKAMDHIGVVNLNYWHPDDHTVSQAETRIAAWSPALRKMKAFDVPDPEFSTRKLRDEAVINSATAIHTPRWIRGDFHERKFT